MWRRPDTLAVVMLAILACGTPDARPVPPAGREYGAGITLERIVDFNEIAVHPDRYQGQPVLTRAHVLDVCQRRGCWLLLTQGDAQVRVRFREYGFFVPRDIAGLEALVEGEVVVEEISEERARHYAEESGRGDPDSIQGPQRVVGFVATGVRIIPEDSGP